MVKNKLNNRGYVLVEIIMASMIAFGVLYYILDLTIKLKNKNDDLFIQTLIETDQAIIQNNLVKMINDDSIGGVNYGVNFDCRKLTASGKVISYNGKQIDTVSQYVTIDIGNITCKKSDDIINISIPLKAGNNTYYTRINYVIKKVVKFV